MTRYMRWLEAERGLELRRRLRGRCGAGRSTSSRTSGPRSGSTSRSAPSATRTSACSPSRDDARRRVVPRRQPQLRRAPARRQAATTGSRSSTPPSARARRAHLGRAARAGRRASPPACARSASSRGDRVVAYMPNSPEALIALPRHRLDRRDLVVAARPTSAPAPWSTASPRSSPRSCSPSTATATTAATSTARDVVAGLLARDADARAHGPPPLPRPRAPTSPRLAQRDRLGRARSTAGAGAELAFEQVPFDHPLWVLYSSGHHRPAEGDRPGPRRDPARAAEEAQPPPRRAARATASSGSRRPAG